MSKIWTKCCQPIGRQVVNDSKDGGPGRDRTDDLFHGISLNELSRQGTEREPAIPKGSVHAGLTAFAIPHVIASDNGKYGATQAGI